MRYKITKISPWKTRNQFFFQVVDTLNRSSRGKRFSNKDIEELVLEKKKIEKEIESGMYGLEFISLKDVFTKYMESLEKRDPSQATINDYNYCAIHLWKIKIKNTFICNIGIKDFTVPDINLINIYMNENFSVRQNKQCFNLLTRIFKFALNHNLGAIFNPCREVDRSEFKSIKKKYDGNKKDPVIVQGGFDQSLEKINGLLDKIKNWKSTNPIYPISMIGMFDNQAYMMVRLMCELGGRMGEVLPLLIADYNPASRTLDINKTVNTSLGTLSHQTKTQTGMRTIALSKTMAALLEDYIKQIPSGIKLLFPSRRNTIIKGNNFANRVLNRFNKELGIVGRINPHSFRHFVITLRDYLEHKKKYMMEDSGHASKQISDLYVKGKWVNLDRKREDADQIAGYLH